MNFSRDRMGEGGCDRIDLDLDSDKWRFLVNTVMNFRVPRNAGNLLD